MYPGGGELLSRVLEPFERKGLVRVSSLTQNPGALFKCFQGTEPAWITSCFRNFPNAYAIQDLRTAFKICNPGIIKKSGQGCFNSIKKNFHYTGTEI